MVGRRRPGNTARNWRRGLANSCLPRRTAPPTIALNRCFAQCCRTAARHLSGGDTLPLGGKKQYARRKEEQTLRFMHDEPDLKGMYFEAKELMVITGLPRSTVYRNMRKSSSRTIRRSVDNQLLLCVEWDDFQRTVKAQKRGNPLWRKGSTAQCGNSE